MNYRNRNSLFFKFVSVIIWVSLPLFLLLFFSNSYAMNLVRDQVAQTNSSLLSGQMSHIDNKLSEINTYMFRLAFQDPAVISLERQPRGSDEYLMTRIAAAITMEKDINYYSELGALFIYSTKTQDLVMTRSTGSQIPQNKGTEDFMYDWMRSEGQFMQQGDGWRTVKVAGIPCLIHVVKSGASLYVGSVIPIQSLAAPSNKVQLVADEQIIFFSDQAEPLTATTISPIFLNQLTGKILQTDKSFHTVEIPDKYLLVTNHSQVSNMIMTVLLPEKNVYKQLSLLQKLIYFLPFVIGCFLIINLVLLKKIVVNPIIRVIRAMRRIQEGDLQYRMPPSHSKELDLLSETFNTMSAEISSLKINVYEEHIKTQQAEIKHLQLQINPHFLLNSLNIAYNLIATKKSELAQKMIVHLMNYFRSMMRSPQKLVTITEEMKHIGHYLQIHKMRFPLHFDFSIECNGHVGDLLIPSLIFQPFVENAIIHGMVMQDEGFHLKIICYEEHSDNSNGLWIHIEDNGNGFSEQSLQRFVTSGQASGDAGNLGIQNVKQRLQAYYANEARLLIGNGLEKGAVVRLFIPKK
ncbi:HAMP domain-containing protein [Paenibacillus sp. LMG 31461]|uniref:HAMP domain-containing protein n=1 Tax=Paenibacillus plantarum TaxID=2654975 RepID=A0ABX1XHE0_9BACL|nr:histidine kinase [Paenibacillus plantarum]NOU67847.1 HAMP domain-containing protein [Paenibacillus plantarum]